MTRRMNRELRGLLTVFTPIAACGLLTIALTSETLFLLSQPQEVGPPGAVRTSQLKLNQGMMESTAKGSSKQERAANFPLASGQIQNRENDQLEAAATFGVLESAVPQHLLSALEDAEAAAGEPTRKEMNLTGAMEWKDGEPIGETDEAFGPLQPMVEQVAKVEQATDDFIDGMRPDWLEKRYIYLGLTTIITIALVIMVLGFGRLMKVADDFKAWRTLEEVVYRGFLYPALCDHAVVAIFNIARPLFVLRYLNLGVFFVGLLTFVQPLMQFTFAHLSNRRLIEVGNKELQRQGALVAAFSGLLFFGLFIPLDNWMSGGPLGSFTLLMLAEALTGIGLTMFRTSASNAMANPAILPSAWTERTSQILYASAMLSNGVGALVASQIAERVGAQWIYVFPLPIYVILYFLVDSIPDSLFKEDPDKKFMAIALPWRLWKSPLLQDEETRWLMLSYSTFNVLFSCIVASFTFALPLLALENGFTDEDTGFLVAIPAFIGLAMFWTGGSSGLQLNLRGAIAALVIGLAHLAVAGLHRFGPLAVAAIVFATARANAAGLLESLRVFYARLAACRGLKAHFASFSGTLTQLDNLLNIPIIVGIVAVSSLSNALLLYAGVAILAAIWYTCIMGKDLDRVQELFSTAKSLPEQLEEAKEAKELFSKLAAVEGSRSSISIAELLTHIEQNKLHAEGLATFLRMADADGDGIVTEEEFMTAYRASQELGMEQPEFLHPDEADD